MANSGDRLSEALGCQFTLPGLLLIIALISVSIALLIPVQRAAHESSNRAACVGNLCQMYRAMCVYASAFGKNKDYMPHTGDAFFTCLLGHTDSAHPDSYVDKAPCTGNMALYVCPTALGTAVVAGGTWPDYLGPARWPEVPMDVPSALADGVLSTTPIACDRPGNHKPAGAYDSGGGNVLRFDGSVSFRQEEYQAAVKACSD